MVLTTSGMWTDENRLLQKLHQEAGEHVPKLHECKVGDIVASPLDKPSD